MVSLILRQPASIERDSTTIWGMITEMIGVALLSNSGLSRTFRASTQRLEREHGVEQSRRDRTYSCDNEYWPTCADEYWPTLRCLIC